MASGAWELAGNAANTANDFLGTSDSQPLVIKTSGSERLRVDTDGNVGVGTSSPTYPVHLAVGKVLRIEGGTSSDDTADYFSFGGNGTFGIDAPGFIGGRFMVQNDGQVRVGAGNGMGSLGVDRNLSGDGAFDIIPNGSFLASGAGVGIGTATPQYDLHLAPGKVLRIEGGETTLDNSAYFSFAGNGAFGIDAPDVPNGRFVVDNSGNIGIGMPSPSHGVHLATGKALRIEGGTSGTDDASYFSFGGNGTFGIDAPGVPNGRFFVDNSGNVGIGTTSPSTTLHVAGKITVTQDVLLTGGEDCAEEFDAGDGQPPAPGTVVVIDEAGGLKESQQAYDKRVAGVVSGGGSYRAALVLAKRQSDQPRITVALVGKVYCQADARQSPIEVGDLLTTSATPGHAMKATEPLRAFGAVIGKALEPLARGQGLIPILVALQ